MNNLPPFPAEASSAEVSVNTNVSWTAMSNDAWLTIGIDLGDGNEVVPILVSKNVETSSRVGTVVFTQDPGGDDLVKTLTVTQEGAELTDLYDLINTGTGLPSDKVKVHSFSKEEVNGTDKFNYASNTLDKDNSTVWAADDGDVIAGDYKGDGEYIIYDLGNDHNVDLIQFTTTNKSDPFGFQFWTSSTGTADSDFSLAIPASDELLLTATNTMDFNQYEVSLSQVRYIKLIGYGRFNSAGDTRTSVWSAVGEIEFYGKAATSLQESTKEPIVIYPNPANEVLFFKNTDEVLSVEGYTLEGRRLIHKPNPFSRSIMELDISTIPNGLYIVKLHGEKESQSQLVYISR